MLKKLLNERHRPEEKFRLFAANVSFSAEAAAGDLANYFCYGVVTAHRQEITPSGRFLNFQR